jgi:hypothetical protein
MSQAVIAAVVCNVVVFVATMRTLNAFQGTKQWRAWVRWLSILCFIVIVLMPSLAIVTSAVVGLGCAGILMAMAINYYRVPSGRQQAGKLSMQAIVLAALAVAPYLFTL